MTDPKKEKIKSITLELTTGTSRRSSTDNAVEMYVGGHTWSLDLPHYDDFERGKTDTYELEVPEGMDASWFRYLCFRKKTTFGKEDDWLLQKIKLTINGKVVYEKEKLDAWLKEDKTSFCAPDFTFGAAGG